MPLVVLRRPHIVRVDAGSPHQGFILGNPLVMRGPDLGLFLWSPLIPHGRAIVPDAPRHIAAPLCDVARPPADQLSAQAVLLGWGIEVCLNQADDVVGVFLKDDPTSVEAIDAVGPTAIAGLRPERRSGWRDCVCAEALVQTDQARDAPRLNLEGVGFILTHLH